MQGTHRILQSLPLALPADLQWFKSFYERNDKGVRAMGPQLLKGPDGAPSLEISDAKEPPHPIGDARPLY